MLSDIEKQAITEELAHHAHKRGACIEALRIVQRQRRWVSDEALCDVAALLDMTPAEVDNVATFYCLIFRRPVGRHVIYLCDSLSCWIMGSERLLQSLSDCLGIKLGETTADDRFTLLPISCLGCCDHAPALMVDSDLYKDVDPTKLEPILARYL